MPSPEVLDNLTVQGTFIRNQFRVEEPHALEGILMENPLAESVNRVNGRFIEIPQRRPQNTQLLISTFCHSGLDPESRKFFVLRVTIRDPVLPRQPIQE